MQEDNETTLLPLLRRVGKHTHRLEVQVDRRVADRIRFFGLHLALSNDDHVLLCGPAGSPGMLHTWIIDTFIGHRAREGKVVHHRDFNKLNNTLANLGIGTREQHEYLHKKHKQRFTRRRRLDLRGFHRPRSPSEVVDRQDLAEQWNQAHKALAEAGVPLSPAVPVRSQRAPRSGIASVRELRTHLAGLIDQVREAFAGTPHSGATRDPASKEWAKPETFLLRLHRPSRLSRADAALVGLMILAKMQRDQVASWLAVAQGLVDRMCKKPSTNQALHDWIGSRTVPHLLLLKRRRRRRSVHTVSLLP